MIVRLVEVLRELALAVALEQLADSLVPVGEVACELGVRLGRLGQD